jgi:hypothetical protein
MIYDNSIQLITWFSWLKDWIFPMIYSLDTIDVLIKTGYFLVIYGYS